MAMSKAFLTLPRSHITVLEQFFKAISTITIETKTGKLVIGEWLATVSDWPARVQLHVVRTTLSDAWERVVVRRISYSWDYPADEDAVTAQVDHFVSALLILADHPDLSPEESANVRTLVAEISAYPLRMRWPAVYWIAHTIVDWVTALDKHGYPEINDREP